MMDSKVSSIKRLTARESIKNIILPEMKSVIFEHKGSAYIKFIMLAVGIEYLGAFFDSEDFNTEGLSQKRFDNALKKLFPKKYHDYSKSDNKYYLYEKFRCPYVHQIRPGKNVVITHTEESKTEGTTHLKPTDSGLLVLVLEDFFTDFEKAINNLFKLDKKGKLPSNKLDQEYNRYISVQHNK